MIKGELPLIYLYILMARCIDLLYVLAQSYPFQEVVEPLSF